MEKQTNEKLQILAKGKNLALRVMSYMQIHNLKKNQGTQRNRTVWYSQRKKKNRATQTLPKKRANGRSKDKDFKRL